MPYHIHIDERGIERLLRTFLKTDTIVEPKKTVRVLFSYGFFRHFNHIPRISKKLFLLVFMNNEYSFLLTNLQIKPLY